jgi:hypothetical protein
MDSWFSECRMTPGDLEELETLRVNNAVRTHNDIEAFVLANKLGPAISHSKLADSRISVFTTVTVERHSLDSGHGIVLCMRAKVDICGDREIVHIMQSL